MDLRNSKIGKFGEIIGIGCTIGEEILYKEDENKKEILRMEYCFAIEYSCVL